MQVKTKQQMETKLRAVMGELELVNQLRRKNTRRYDILMTQAQTLAWCLGQRDNLDAPAAYAPARGEKTLDEIRDALANTHPELFDLAIAHPACPTPWVSSK